MIKIGITGQSGFVGTHIYNTLGLSTEKYFRVPFEDHYFIDLKKLENFVGNCDVIIHLAAMNRHNDPKTIYETNIHLVKLLINAMEKTNSVPCVIFSSSTQEERDNLYGKSKKEGRILFENWAKKNNASFLGLIIPNIFGPFGHPYYNSVIATFCHQLTHNETPKIEIDGELKLIYVGELAEFIIKKTEEKVFEKNTESLVVPFTSSIKVSDLLNKLQKYKLQYFENGEIPSLENTFDKNLFNTFVCYIEHKSFYPYMLKSNIDNRGSFIETMKLNSGGQISFSTTAPGITRGNHFHTRKAERFAVIKGKALIEMRRIGTNEKISFLLNGESPSFVDMPIWFTHNIKNIGNEELFTLFWINEHFNVEDTDTFSEVV